MVIKTNMCPVFINSALQRHAKKVRVCRRDAMAGEMPHFLYFKVLTQEGSFVSIFLFYTLFEEM
jgi:hypothetical protein